VAGLEGLPLADDDRPRFSGHVPASGAPLTPRTLALRPNPQSLNPGDDNRTSSDMLADAVYGFLQRHPNLGVPEEGQRNLAEFARGVNQLTPWGSGESAVNSAKSGDLVGTASGIFGATPLLGAAGGVGAKVAKTVAKDAGESVASNLAKRAVLTGAEDAATSAAPTATEAAAPAIKGRVRATPAPAALTPSVPDTVAAAAQPPRDMTDLASLRRIPAAEGAAIAREDPHLIPAGGRSPGYFLGGPPQVQSPEDLQALRERVYQRLAGAQQGSTWYDRYRDDITRLTGGDATASKWMANTEATFSPQRAPPVEFNFATKETSGPIAGVDSRASQEIQHQKYLSSVAANDPTLQTRGNKVSEYAYQIDPARALDPDAASATGVNDFRHGQEFGYPKAGGVSAPQHQFLDYETARLVDRANAENLGGRNDWTGEQVQAALWVRQKAEDILTRDRPNLIRDRIAMGMSPDEAWKDAWDKVAFPAANSTLRESFPERTLFATHESRPGVGIPNHMTDAATASPEDLAAFHADPRSTWANAPVASNLLQPGELPGRDALYAGLYPEDRPGAGMRVLPSRPMTGLYTPPGEGAATEMNPGAVARPIVSFNTGDDGEKSLTDADRAIINGVESLRAYTDAQNAGAATKVWPVKSLKNSNAYFTPLEEPATPEAMMSVKGAGEQHGMPDVIDTGQGMLAQSFEGPQGFTSAQRRAAEASLGGAHVGDWTPVKSESVYVPYASDDKNYWTGAGLEPIDTPWQQGPGAGTGQATTKMLSDISATPELKAAITQNPYIPANAGARADRDYDWTSTMGAPWEAIQNARKIMAAGGDWPSELQKAMKYGVPAATAAGVALTPTAGLPAEQQPPASVASSPGFDDWWRQLQNQRFAAGS
jgi:hypothetical protein